LFLIGTVAASETELE